MGQDTATPEPSVTRDESAPESTIMTIGRYDIGKRQLLGLIGSIVLFLGVFAPIVSIPIAGNISYFQYGKGDGVIVLILAVVSFILTMKGRYKELSYTGLGSLGITAFTFISLEIRMYQASSQIRSELTGNPFKGLVELAVQSIQLQWGCAVLVVGAALVIGAAVMKEERKGISLSFPETPFSTRSKIVRSTASAEDNPMPQFKNKEEYELWKASRLKPADSPTEIPADGGNAQEASSTTADLDPRSHQTETRVGVLAAELLSRMAHRRGRLLAYVVSGFLALIVTVYGFNYVNLQSPMNRVLRADARNEEIDVSVHYSAYVNPSVLVYDLRSVGGTKSMADVFRVFLQFAAAVKTQRFDALEMAFRGTTKFKISGEYFRKVGEEYSWQNPVYTMRTFPQNLMRPDGVRAYPGWTGGMLGVLTKQMDDYRDFHKKWYVEDLARSWARQ